MRMRRGREGRRLHRYVVRGSGGVRNDADVGVGALSSLLGATGRMDIAHIHTMNRAVFTAVTRTGMVDSVMDRAGIQMDRHRGGAEGHA